jgi:hypothetical protein
MGNNGVNQISPDFSPQRARRTRRFFLDADNADFLELQFILYRTPLFLH